MKTEKNNGSISTTANKEKVEKDFFEEFGLRKEIEKEMRKILEMECLNENEATDVINGFIEYEMVLSDSDYELVNEINDIDNFEWFVNYYIITLEPDAISSFGMMKLYAVKLLDKIYGD